MESSGADQSFSKPVLQSSKSFSRLEPTPRNSPLNRSRASTIDSLTYPTHRPEHLPPSHETTEEDADVFANKEEADGGQKSPVPPVNEVVDSTTQQGMETFEQLPIELRSLTERFLESLSTRRHTTPLTIDNVSELFQEFYQRADAQIATHIASLSAKLSRDKSPAPSTSSRTSASSKTSGKMGLAKAGTFPIDNSVVGEQQMLSASEMTDRKKARRDLELKRHALEEAVERVVCEKVYDRIFQHRSTDDEERDAKLRSRTAALAVLGIGLKDLLITAEDVPQTVLEMTPEKEDEIREWLSEARTSLQAMSDEKYPLGKLRHLTAAHKSIVETLSRVFPASSSADEILPTVIYTLISLPPEGVNAISNLSFIQRFRGSTRMDGEAAYCLVNLEASISFLETVDLSSLRADAVPQISKSSSSAPTPQSTSEKPSPPTAQPIKGSLSPIQSPANTAEANKDGAGPPPSSPTKHSRRLSNLFQAQTNRLEAASDAVRDAVLNGADEAFDSINNTLENSFKFLFGRLREEQASRHAKKAALSPQLPNAPPVPIATDKELPDLPRTLEDARKLVSSPKEEDTASVSSSLLDPEDAAAPKGREPNRLVELVGGRRDRSADSARSGGSSSKRVSFISGATDTSTAPTSAPAPERTASSSTVGSATAAARDEKDLGPVESMKTFGNSLNPLNRFSPMGMFPKFGRSPTAPAATESSAAATTAAGATQSAQAALAAGASEKEAKAVEAALLKEASAMAVLEDLKRTAPPSKRFLECKDVKDLRLGEVSELLKEYQRLAGALRSAIIGGKELQK